MQDMIAKPALIQSNAILGLVSRRVSDALVRCGFEASGDAARISDRPDISDFQSNIAFRLAKRAGKPPRAVAEALAGALSEDAGFTEVRVDGAGFVNFRLSAGFLAEYLTGIAESPRFGAAAASGGTFFVDYGGPNVAKSMHVGHLRSTIIGDCLVRLLRFVGFKTVSDVHLGDWGTQMGMLIHEFSLREPQLPYFDPDYAGPYPEQPPLTLEALEEMYPAAAARSKENPADRDAARQIGRAHV